MSAYAVTAQFYDAVAEEQAAAVQQHLTQALEGLDTGTFPVIDIGAGTGLSTQAIANVLPDVEILAIEPDPAMRSAIMTRVVANSDLRRRVSVIPASILDAPLPATLSAAVACAALVHFSPDERLALWSLLACRLSTGGRAVIEIQCSEAESIAETRVASATVGQVNYEAWGEAQRLDDRRQRWCMRYVAKLGDRVIDEQSASYLCHVASSELVIAEAEPYGFTGMPLGDYVVLTNS